MLAQYATRGSSEGSVEHHHVTYVLQRTSVSQLIACGSGSDMQLVQSISSGSMQAELQMREDSRANVFHSVNMTLSRVQPVKERMPTPKDGVMLNGLAYRVAGKQVGSLTKRVNIVTL